LRSFRLPVQLVDKKHQKGNIDEGHEDEGQQKGDNQGGEEAV